MRRQARPPRQTHTPFPSARVRLAAPGSAPTIHRRRCRCFVLRAAGRSPPFHPSSRAASAAAAAAAAAVAGAVAGVGESRPTRRRGRPAARLLLRPPLHAPAAMSGRRLGSAWAGAAHIGSATSLCPHVHHGPRHVRHIRRSMSVTRSKENATHIRVACARHTFAPLVGVTHASLMHHSSASAAQHTAGSGSLCGRPVHV
eukprot:360038-Chlamydomonas_euryale.AAC.1